MTNTEIVNSYRELAKQYPNVIFGGRLGLYTYADMDDTVAAALELSKKELV